MTWQPDGRRAGKHVIPLPPHPYAIPQSTSIKHSCILTPPDEFWRAIQDSDEKASEELQNSPVKSFLMKPRNEKGATPGTSWAKRQRVPRSSSASNYTALSLQLSCLARLTNDIQKLWVLNIGIGHPFISWCLKFWCVPLRGGTHL